MHSKGFDYAGDRDPWIEFAMGGRSSGSRLTAREISVATADATCQAISHNIDTQVALVVAYETQALTEHADQVAAYRHYLRAILKRSAEITAELPAPVNRREDGRQP